MLLQKFHFQKKGFVFKDAKVFIGRNRPGAFQLAFPGDTHVAGLEGRDCSAADGSCLLRHDWHKLLAQNSIGNASMFGIASAKAGAA
jgi:hypothetical protein